MTVDLVCDDGYFPLVRYREYIGEMVSGKVGAAWVAGVGLHDERCIQLPRTMCQSRTYHEDGPCLLIHQTPQLIQIRLPSVRLDAVIEARLDAQVGQQHGVLRKHRSGEKDVGLLYS